MSHDAPDSLSLDTYPSVPSVVASQARRAVEDFVRTTFPTDAEPWFETTWDEFLGKSNQLFRGPFYSLKLPFKPGEKQGDFFPDVPTSFPPYLHQERAFERLASEPPLSTLIATGAGSGKTESYMIPILDWRRRDRTRRGIKAIIVYPMNALANDQAKRFAKTIYDNPNLRGLRVGLFVGGLDESKATALMSEDSVVTSREAQRETPPDILLTNYKMLDYTLTRPKDYPIWRFNEPGVLRYVVVDELHTFDGAQGVELGEQLLTLAFFQNLIKTLAGNTLDVDELARAMKRSIARFDWKNAEAVAALFDGAFALLGFARRRVVKSDGTVQTAPFLNVRVHWEILKEYGFAARIGRTLEKSNCSIPTLRPEIRDAWADKAARRLTPEFGVFQRLGETAVRNLLTRTILRVVRTMRIEGAIYADFLAEYMRTGSAFQLGRLPFMPNFSEKRAPVFVAKSRALNRRFRTLKTLNDVLSDEVRSAFAALNPFEPSSETESDWTEILEKLFEVGTELGALRCEKIARDVVWGLNPDVFIVETKVAQIKDKRGRLLPIPESELAIFNVEALDGETRAIPKNLKAVLDVISTSNEKTSAFPFNFLQYVEWRRTEIFNSFREIFQEDFGDDKESVLKYLRAFMNGKNVGTLEWKILRPLTSLAQERKTLTSKIKTVHERVKRLESGERDEYVDGQIAALKNEKAYLQDRVKETNQKDVFNFFTDGGLLPNYAFPETGVKLRSVIYRDRKGNEERVAFKARSTVEEYERPGNAAIQEFAPGAVFYVGGRKLTINQIDASPENRETWRFCGNCDHMEKIDPTIPTVPSPCPKCGSATWADGSLTRDVVRLKQVISALSEKNSRAFDADERREPVFFNAHMIVDYDAENVKRAFKAPESETLWGVEYLRKATFREINFGRADAELEVEIGGRKTPEKGFRVCKKCGRVFDETKGRIEHRPYCDYFLKEKKKQNEIELDCFYLYREFESEAIRMLTPLGEMDVEELQPSIIAALLTGLKEYFHGAVDHLQVAVVEEPVADSHVKKRIITIYDQIPGGTGYLKELLKTPDRFFDMLQMARDKLKNCECAKDEEKNGCYRCIYTRRMNRDLSKIKRTEALAFLQSVLAMRDRLKEVTALSEIPVFGLFESELEKRFIEALRRVEYKNAEGQTVRAELKKQVVGGVPGYLYQIGDRVYEIFQQYDIGENEGVERPSRADFLIRSTRQSQDNFKPIAVFTDGFEYHGDILSRKSEYSFHQDLLKRWAISRSGRLRCWSISYDDVKRKFDETTGGYSDDDSPFLRCRPSEVLLRLGKAQEESWARLPETNSFDSLIRFLSAPEAKATADDWEGVAFNFAHELAWPQMKIAVLTEPDDRDAFLADGWRIVEVDEENDGVSAFVEMFNNEAQMDITQ